MLHVKDQIFEIQVWDLKEPGLFFQINEKFLCFRVLNSFVFEREKNTRRRIREKIEDNLRDTDKAFVIDWGAKEMLHLPESRNTDKGNLDVWIPVADNERIEDLTGLLASITNMGNIGIINLRVGVAGPEGLDFPFEEAWLPKFTKEEIEVALDQIWSKKKARRRRADLMNGLCSASLPPRH